jgi:hypothetical protein
MIYSQLKNLILNTKACPDGFTIPACASCLADVIARVDANKCWYCKNARITRSLKLYFATYDFVHLVCENCANALDGEKATFIASKDQI